MDFLFHIQQGQLLLAKEDIASIIKALEHFKKANEMTEHKDISKPKILYHLAYGNLLLGNFELAYKIAHKAKRHINIAIKNCGITMNNMRKLFYEDDIDAMIKHIDKTHHQLVVLIDTKDDKFDDNEIDYGFINNPWSKKNKPRLIPEFSIDRLKEDVIIATFTGLSRTNDDLVYFDKLKGNVLFYVQGYFTSLTGDQNAVDRQFENRITNNEPIDYVDEERYILIDPLSLAEFLNEFRAQTNGKEPFLSYVNYFAEEAIKKFSSKKNKDLTISIHMQKAFHEIFNEKYLNVSNELRNEYVNIFGNTCKALAIRWIKLNI